MKKLNLSARELRDIGYESDRAISIAINTMMKHYKRTSKSEMLEILINVIKEPKKFQFHQQLGKISEALLHIPKQKKEEIKLNTKRDYIIYGQQHIESSSILQMDMAMSLPISVKGALMPDAHQGYGLPIGGVLATEKTVIPYGVGMDIGCRMCLTVYNLPISILEQDKKKLKTIITEHTRFGNAEFHERIEHEVLDRNEFNDILFLKSLQKKAWQQLGTSGHGNHFVDFGIFEYQNHNSDWKIETGNYFAILSHSGSRGMGAEIARHYTRIAQEKCQLPKGAKNLAWLELESEEGQEYWKAMTLAGDYSKANHQQIHFRLAQTLGEQPILKIENHHNFAWKETIGNNFIVIVHRKGATPAHEGIYGIIPGSMASPAFIVKGLGNEDSLNSASHGAGRVMSRSAAKSKVSQKELSQLLEKMGITLIGGGTDESPEVYKNIHTVMSHQKDMVEIKALFHPKIVRME